MRGLSLAVASGAVSHWVCRALLAMAPFIGEHGFQSISSVVVVCALTRPAACGTFPDQGSNMCPLHWQNVNPWDSLGKNADVGCHFLLQGIFLT